MVMHQRRGDVLQGVVVLEVFVKPLPNVTPSSASPDVEHMSCTLHLLVIPLLCASLMGLMKTSRSRGKALAAGRFWLGTQLHLGHA